MTTVLRRFRHLLAPATGVVSLVLWTAAEAGRSRLADHVVSAFAVAIGLVLSSRGAAPLVQINGVGTGIVGMHDRARLAGGWLRAEPARSTSPPGLEAAGTRRRRDSKPPELEAAGARATPEREPGRGELPRGRSASGWGDPGREARGDVATGLPSVGCARSVP